MWHRGNKATARDLLDLSLVIAHMPKAFVPHKAIFTKHSQAFIAQCHARKALLKPQFEQINTLNFTKTYEECLAIVESFLIQLENTI